MMDGHLSKNHSAPLRGFREWLTVSGLSSLTCIKQGVTLAFEWLVWAQNNSVLQRGEKVKVSLGLRLAEKKNHSSVKRLFLSISLF